jgi:hypothetical protein
VQCSCWIPPLNNHCVGEESIIVEVVLRVGERVIDFGLRLRLCVTCHCCFDFDFDSITDRLAIIAVVEVVSTNRQSGRERNRVIFVP